MCGTGPCRSSKSPPASYGIDPRHWLERSGSSWVEHTVERIREATGGRGADVVLNFVGSDATLAMGAASARPMGDLSIVGIAGGTLPVSFFSIPYEVSVQTTYWGTRPELVELLGLAARGVIGSRVTTYSLEDAPDAYAALKAGTVEGRAVVVPFPTAEQDAGPNPANPPRRVRASDR